MEFVLVVNAASPRCAKEATYFWQSSPYFEAAHRGHHAPGMPGVRHSGIALPRRQSGVRFARKLSVKWRKQVSPPEFLATLKKR
jgi:hypothetical protein